MEQNFIKDGKAGELIYISIEKLHPHPDNPRKDLGDLTELCESIKVNGIFQNLTVVPCTGYHYGDYTVVIGHRRMAAAKLAGLSELPCVIAEMSEREQLAAMLLENMQRSALTEYEEACGMQMMLDLGDTIETIAESTGISETTVRRRLKLKSLDEEKLRGAIARGGTVMDYEKVYSIKDRELQNKVLDAVGTNNFEWEYKKAIEKERKEEKSGIILDRLKTFAKEKQEDGKYKFIQFVDSNFKTPDDIDSVQYYYKQEGGSFWLYREKTPEEIEEDNAKDEQTAKNEQNKRLREELSKRAFEQRCEFVKVAYAGKNRADDIMRFAFGSIIRNQAKWERITNEKFCIAAGIDTDNTQVLNEIRTGEYDITCTRALMVCAYCNYHDSKSNTYFDYYGSYKENEELDELYDFFESIGYKMSDEERAFRDGTHELFKTE